MIIIAILFFKKKLKIGVTGWIIIFNIIVIGAYGLYSKLTNDYPGTINIIRTYTMPCLAYFVAKNIDLDDKKYAKALKITGYVFAAIAIYGLFQAFVLGPKFLVDIGYRGDNGKLISWSFFISHFYGEQRVTGTFVSPNTMAIIFAMVLLAIGFSKQLSQWKNRSVVMFISIMALICTFSRSAIVGFVGAIFCFFAYKFIYEKYKTNLNLPKKSLSEIINNKILEIKTSGKLSRYIIVLVLFVVLAVLDIVLRRGLFFIMLYSSFGGIVTGTDPSAQKHFDDLKPPTTTKLPGECHDERTGFGSTGPMAVSLMEDAKNYESSILLMISEIGLIFAIIYFIPYLLVIFRTLADAVRKKSDFFVPACATIAVLFTYLLLPNVQSFEIPFYAFFFIGLYENRGLNPNITDIKLPKFSKEKK